MMTNRHRLTKSLKVLVPLVTHWIRQVYRVVLFLDRVMALVRMWGSGAGFARWSIFEIYNRETTVRRDYPLRSFSLGGQK